MCILWRGTPYQLHVPLRHGIAATGTRNRSHYRGTYSLSEFNINKFCVFFLIQELDHLAKRKSPSCFLKLLVEGEFGSYFALQLLGKFKII